MLLLPCLVGMNILVWGSDYVIQDRAKKEQALNTRRVWASKTFSDKGVYFPWEMWSSSLHCLARTNILRSTPYPSSNAKKIPAHSVSLIFFLYFLSFFFFHGKTTALRFLFYTENKGTEHTHVLPGNVPALQEWQSVQVQGWVFSMWHYFGSCHSLLSLW